MDRNTSSCPSGELTPGQLVEMLKWWREDHSKQIAWNRLRKDHPGMLPDLQGVDLSHGWLESADLSHAHMNGADFSHSWVSDADMTGAHFVRAKFAHANLRMAKSADADLYGAYFGSADLRETDCCRANFARANFDYSNLTNAAFDDAIFLNAHFGDAVLSNTRLRGAALRGASFGNTVLANLDLLSIQEPDDLASCVHSAPSSIDTHTLKAAKGRLPDEFLRGIGLEQWEVELAKLYDPCIQGNDFVDRLYRIYDMKAIHLILE